MGFFDKLLSNNLKPTEKRKYRKEYFRKDSVAFSNEAYNKEPDKNDDQTLLETIDANAWVYACIYKLATSVASVPFKIEYWNEDGSKTDITRAPEFLVFNAPNPWFTRFDFWEATTVYLESTGKCFWELVRDEQGNVREIYPLIPSYMKPIKHRKKFIIGWRYELPQGPTITYKVEDIVFLRYFDPRNPYDGLSPLEAGSKAVAGDIYAQEYGLSFYQNSGRPDGLLVYDAELSDEDYERIRGNWNKSHQGPSKAHRIAIIEQGMEYKTISFTQKDMQFIAQRKYNRDEILASFGVPPATVGVFESAIKANAETQERMFWTETMTPKLIKLAEMVHRTIIPFMIGDSSRFDLRRIATGFDTSKIYILSQIWRDREQFLKDHINSGAMVKDEARVVLNNIYDEIMYLPPLEEGGKDVVAAQNMNNIIARAPQEIEPIEVEKEGNVIEADFKKQDVADIAGTIAFNMDSPEVIEILNTKPMIVKTALENNEIVRGILVAGIAEGLNIKDIQANIWDRFNSSGDFSIERTNRIARTENTGAANGATLQAYKQSGVVEKKIWLTARDKKVRPATKWDKGNHVRLDGEQQNLDDEFSNGLRFPGDQGGRPEEVVNCRCTMISKTVETKKQVDLELNGLTDNEIIKGIQWRKFIKQTERFERQIQNLFLQYFEDLGKEYMRRLDVINLTSNSINTILIEPDGAADRINQDYKPLKTAIVNEIGQKELDKLRG